MEPRDDELEADQLADEREPDEVDDSLWPGEVATGDDAEPEDDADDES
jgi:hypothetical protein